MSDQMTPTSDKKLSFCLCWNHGERVVALLKWGRGGWNWDCRLTHLESFGRAARTDQQL